MTAEPKPLPSARRLREDLAWSDDAAGGALLIDPITRRELALSPPQAEVLRALTAHPDLRLAAQAASASLATEITPELVAAFLDALDALALLEPAPPAAEILERQRAERREHFREERRAKLANALAAWRELPYYAELLPVPGPEPDAPEDVARYPILDKATLRTRLSDFLPAASSRDEIVWLSTSGTTGERQQIARSWVDWDAAQPWTWTLNAALRGVLGEPFCKLTTPNCSGTECHLREMSRAERTSGARLLLESYPDMAGLPPERVRRIAAELCEHQPAYVLADPSYLAIVVDHTRRLRLPLPRPRFVITSYELLSALHRRAIEDAFACPVYDAYGASEFGALAVQCELGRYHVNPQSYELELLSTTPGATEPAAPGTPGRMVVTTLDKTVMPLLRYDTGDLAIRAAAPCTCGWSETDLLASLEGRLADVITTTDGRPLTAAAVDRAIAPAARGIVTYCLVQLGARAYRLEVLPAHDDDPAATSALADALMALLGRDARVRIERRRELLPAPSGKFRLAMPAAPASGA